MGDLVRDRDSNAKKRRSTRVAQALPIIVRGLDAQGQAFQEHTSTVSINCFGCRFQSKHEISVNTWISLEIPHRSPGHAPRSIRARVSWVTPARTGHERVYVGAELEIPGNVWGMAFPPEDWFPYPEGVPEGASPATLPAEEDLPALKVVPPAHPPAVQFAPMDRLPDVPEPPDRGSLAQQVSRIVDEAKEQIEKAAHETAARTSEAVRQLTSAMERAEHLCVELSATAAKIQQNWEERMQLSLHDAAPRVQQVLDSSVESASRAAEARFDEHVRAEIESFCLQSAKLACAHNESFERARVEAENMIGTLCTSLDAEMGKARILLNDLREGTTGLEEAGNRLEAFRKTANEELKWHSKRIENQVGLTIERATEQAAKALGEKAAEITSRFAGQLDHYSRSYVEHTQAQLDDIAGGAAVHSQEVLQQMVETAATGLRAELAQIEERVSELGSADARPQGDSQGQEPSTPPEWSKAADAAIEDFKKRLENVANSWLVTTAAILNNRAQENLNAIVKEAEDRLRHPSE